MAGYAKISATATVVNCLENIAETSTHSQPASPFNLSSTVYNVQVPVPTNHSAGPITEKKIYIPMYLKKYLQSSGMFRLRFRFNNYASIPF
jgi:hypothetical protein